MFDVLVQIYEAYGYTAREAAASIIEHNIWGLDIDTRAAQLSYFSLMMKARQYDRRFFSRKVQPHVYAIQESNNLDEHSITYFVNSKASLATSIRLVIDSLFNAKEYGSIIDCSEINFDELFARVDEIQSEEEPSLYSTSALDQLLPLIQIANVIAQKYHVVVTNPPYMSASGMSSRLSEYVKKHFPESKADLFAVFIEKCGQMCQPYGFQAMITQQAWMFLSGYERLRDKLRKQKDIINLVHLGAHAFEEIGGEVVQTAAFIMMKGSVPGRIGSYVRLVKQGSQSAKEQAFLSGANRYEMKQEDFLSVPGQRIVYWLGSASLWNHEKISGSFISGGRNKTHNNEKYVREWWEIIRSSDWVLYMNGGNYRKWYGNLQQVVNWTDSAKREYASHGGLVDQKNVDSYGISWNGICGDLYGFRIKPLGIPFSSSSPTIVNQSNIPPLSVLGFLNSAVSHSILTALNPTLQLNVGEVLDTPLELPDDTGRIDELVKDNIAMAKNDWDSYETSWDFQIHPMLPVYADDPDYAYLVSSFFKGWASRCEDRFNKIKANEGELNRIFIDAYGLQGELSPEVEDKDITVRKAELQRDIKSLISYAVGCMFGRYAYDGAGLAYAGGEWDESRYGFIPVDRDNIIPICDDEYFEDDIVGRFVEFIRKAYGNTTLEENLRFIADALGGSGSPRDVIRNYFINDFYADHLKIYQKRPIYWLFDSGKKNGFKCLIYMHRYHPDTIARIRTDYVHEQQSRYRTAIADLESRIANAGTSERVKLSRQLTKLQEQAEELRVYEEKIHHLADQMIRIDLDDGVKHNYAIFQDVLAKIK